MGYPSAAKASLISPVAQQGSVSSFIEPERSSTKAMSRGLAMATAEAFWVKSNWLKIAPKKNRDLPPVDSSVRAVTRTALPGDTEGVNVRVSTSQVPYSTSAEPS